MSTQIDPIQFIFDSRLVIALLIWLIFTLCLVHKFKWKMIAALWRVLRGLPLVGCLITAFVGLIFLPGTALHEFSHALLVKLIGGNIEAISLFPRETEEGGIELGYVYSEDKDTAFVGLGGLAPLLVGSLVVFLIFQYGFDIQPSLYEDVTQFFETLDDVGQKLVQKPLWLIYLLFVCGNGALPSATDYKDVPRTFMSQKPASFV